MKKEIKTIEFNLDHIQDRQDSAREYITDFRDRHDFTEQCNELRRELWPVIHQAKADINELIAELDRETKDLNEQVPFSATFFSGFPIVFQWRCREQERQTNQIKSAQTSNPAS